jgi:hypothetical protein
VEIVFGLAIVAIVLGVAFGRSVWKRRELETELDVEPEKRRSRRQKKLDEIRANDPDPVIPTLEELVAQELADTGVNDINGNDALAEPVKLKVYHRDIANLADCPREALTFRLSYGIDVETATVDDVRLVCDAEAAAAVEDAESDPAADTDDTSESNA